MYHLFVTASAGTWDGSPYTYDISRAIREYTDEAIKERFQALDETAIAELLAFPALFAYEEAENYEAKVGYIYTHQAAIKRSPDRIWFFPRLKSNPCRDSFQVGLGAGNRQLGDEPYSLGYQECGSFPCAPGGGINYPRSNIQGSSTFASHF
jgi:hypothetical protein